jgi:hypothetical protein
MRERLFIILSLVVIVVALVGLNAASYAPTEVVPDTEETANRSTYNSGASGTRAFFDFLRETGRPVVRWQEKPFALRGQANTNKPKTFVVLGNQKREFEEAEINDLLSWVAEGNKLVMIDRNPPARLLPPSGNWQVEAVKPLTLFETGDSSNVNEMTKDVVAAKPAQPAVLTAQVNSVMPSKYATAIRFKSVLGDNVKADEDETFSFPEFTPVVHLASRDKNILVDYKYGAGRIVVLSDPYIVSNGGIGLVDNLKLASNVVGNDGLIAFDEYHQGYGASGNSFVNYFQGTPIPALFAQFGLIVILLLYTQGKRFGRPLPLANPDRRSKLEYVGAMAELQRSTRAYDLAIENIYGRVRRELARFAGVDNLTTSAADLADRVAERSNINRLALQHLLRDCEDAIHGAPLSQKEALALAAKLRELEQQLGFQKRSSMQK